MKFGPVPLENAVGAILAHSLKAGARRIAKGKLLDETDLDALRETGLSQVVVARLEPGDLNENDSAARIADTLASDSLRAGSPGNGRCNLYARHAGVLVVDPAGVEAANLIDESLTLATLPPFAAVTPGQLVATVKIITYGASALQVDAVAAAAAGTVSVAAYNPQSAALIQTRLPHTPESLLRKTEQSNAGRLRAVGATLEQTTVTAHDPQALSAALLTAAETNTLIVVIGASAIADRRDVVPEAIAQAGGEILHFGLPVDPGNLTLIGHLGDTTVVAMPGSARSPREQGSDWVLQRLAAGLPVDSKTIAGFGVGGLLKEIRSRPMPRDQEADSRPTPAHRVDAVLLAAGQSRRMGPDNKLLQELDGQPMVRRVADAIAGSKTRRLIVVTGHEANAIENALKGVGARFVHNAGYSDGMGTSVAAGVSAVFDAADPPDAVLVCLGDMPDITPDIIDRLLGNYDPDAGRAIVVAAHQGQRGNPVLWDRRFADDLTSLTGDRGARDILREHGEHVIAVELDDAAVLRDVDTPEALDARRRENRRRTAGEEPAV